MKAAITRYLSCLAVVLTLSLLGFGQSSSSQSTTGDQGSTSGSASTTTGHKHKASKSDSSDMNSSSSATGGQLTGADKTFVTKAAEGGLAEVQLGQLAQQKAQDPKVKEFGQRMVDDHTKANDQLKSIASQKGVTLPTDLNAKDKAEMDRLNKLSGTQFDKAYMSHMVQDHTKDVSEFQKESKSGKDSDVKSFASTTLPTLQQHLQMAKQINQSSGAKASNSSSNSSDMSASTSGTSSAKSKKGSSTSASNPPQR